MPRDGVSFTHCAVRRSEGSWVEGLLVLALAPEAAGRTESRQLELAYRFAGQIEQAHLYLRRKRQVLGCAVLRLGERHGASAGYVVDYLCTPEHARLLFAACLKEFRRLGAVAVYCLHIGPAARLLRWLGFFARESTVRLMARPKQKDVDIMPMLADPHCWFVTAGDSDADRA